jgi:hypothetical protein
MSATEHPSGSHDQPNTEGQREPDPFITEEHNLPTVRGKSEGASAPDNETGDQSDLIVRARAAQASLRPDEEEYLKVEHHFDSVPVETSRDTDGTHTASLDEADDASAILVPLSAPSDSDGESPVRAKLREEPASGASRAQDTAGAEITVSVVSEESAVEDIRMSKRVK